MYAHLHTHTHTHTHTPQQRIFAQNRCCVEPDGRFVSSLKGLFGVHYRRGHIARLLLCDAKKEKRLVSASYVRTYETHVKHILLKSLKSQ